MRPDEQPELIPESWVKSLSVEKLLESNILRALPAQKLAEMLLEYRKASPEWGFRELFCAVGRRVASRLKVSIPDGGSDKNEFDALPDAQLVELAVRHGFGFAIGAAWGVSREGDLLWAAAAALIRFHGCEFPSEIGRSEPTRRY